MRWYILIASVLLFINAPAFSQGCSVYWYYMPENGSPLTTVCQGGVPIPDGYEIKIMWDADSDGPDVEDTPAQLCIDPPLCEQGPPGSANINTILFSGEEFFGQGGYFIPERGFQTTGMLQTPPRYYLRIYEADGITPLWTSVVYTVVAGPQDIICLQSEWSCGAGGPQCVVIDEQE